MNQILLTNKDNNKKKNSKYKNSNSNDMKKIIIFFCILIIVFGSSIAVIYRYKISKKQPEATISKPELALEETEENVTIIAKSSIGISKIIYYWNEESPKEDIVSGENYEKMLDIPNGENTLNVQVIDQNGQEIKTSKDFSKIGDNQEPIIEIDETIGNGQIKITATDETAIDYLTYKWNDEEEQIVNSETEEDKVIEITIDARRGENTLKIVAFDLAGNTSNKDKLYKGVNNPIIKVTKEGSRIYMKVSHDMGFEKVIYTINNIEYIYDKDTPGYDSTKKDLEYYFNLQEGENTVIINATSTEKTEATYQGKCEYSAE